MLLEFESHVVELGLWCDHCLLPSGVYFVISFCSDPTSILARCRVCTDCERGLPWPDAHA